ncbi:DUF4177 domain-containing protein [Aeromicrobium sp. CTD01-1L150]|uniref:DUF4177 domain-containing protein n=1 Tax=Aeromicrobium sp. CTD01-1L150 TaxID=3341830 RepID=UPI0035BEFD7B
MSDETKKSATPGWYPDGQGNHRWWDGSQWTKHASPAAPGADPNRTANYEYKVVEVRDSFFRGKQSSSVLEGLLNQHASQGWMFKHMMSDDIKGRLGLGSTSGVMMVFERAV